eukprot:g74.t1
MARPGTAYLELTARTGGAKHQVCETEWNPIFKDIAEAVSKTARIPCVQPITYPSDGSVKIGSTPARLLYSNLAGGVIFRAAYAPGNKCPPAAAGSGSRRLQRRRRRLQNDDNTTTASTAGDGDNDAAVNITDLEWATVLNASWWANQRGNGGGTAADGLAPGSGTFFNGGDSSPIAASTGGVPVESFFTVDNVADPKMVSLCGSACSLLGEQGKLRFEYDVLRDAPRGACIGATLGDNVTVECRLGQTMKGSGADAGHQAPPLSEGSVTLPAKLVPGGDRKLSDGNEYKLYTCDIPAYPPLMKDAPSSSLSGHAAVDLSSMEGRLQGAAWGPVEYKVALDVLVNGQVVLDKPSDSGTQNSATFEFSYRTCCAALPPPLVWPFWLLLPVTLGLCTCCVCVIYVRQTGPLQMPELLYADGAARPKTPGVIMEKRVVEQVIRRPLSPPPKKKPPKKAEKKKWDTVATGQYLRNGAHMEVKWGEFGEMGGETIIKEESESDSDDGKDDGEKFEEQKVLHETLNIEIEVPKGVTTQFDQLQTVKSPISKGGENELVYGTCSCCKHWRSLIGCLVSFILFIAVIVALVFIGMAADELAGDYTPTCAGNNVTELCADLDVCSGCDGELLCECSIHCGRPPMNEPIGTQSFCWSQV